MTELQLKRNPVEGNLNKTWGFGQVEHTPLLFFVGTAALITSLDSSHGPYNFASFLPV